MKNNLKMEDKKIMQSMLDTINKAKKIIKDTKAESINNISLPIDFVEQLLNMLVQHMENEVKTLEQLGFIKNDEDSSDTDVFIKGDSYAPDISIILFSDGTFMLGEYDIIDKNIYDAIGLEMKRKGWWK